MKRNLSALLGTLALAFVPAAPLAAQALRVTATIPFEFFVGGDRMPAGEYAVETGALPGALYITKTDQRAYTFILSQRERTASGSRSTAVKLVFHRYDNLYFLKEVQDGVRASVIRLPLSIEESRLARKNPPRAFEPVSLQVQGD